VGSLELFKLAKLTGMAAGFMINGCIDDRFHQVALLFTFCADDFISDLLLICVCAFLQHIQLILCQLQLRYSVQKKRMPFFLRGFRRILFPLHDQLVSVIRQLTKAIRQPVIHDLIRTDLMDSSDRTNWLVIVILNTEIICQLPRWIGLLLSMLALPPAAFLIMHIAASQLLLLLLDRFCLPSIHRVISSRPRLLACMGALPLLYYAYEYFLLYTNRRYAHLLLLSELLPTGLVIFFILFAVVYQQEAEKRAQAERQMNTLHLKLHQAGQEVEALRAIEEQTAIFRHDMHHHLIMISGFLSSGKPEAATQYIMETRQQIDAIVPAQLCDHEAANLLLCAYKSRAEHLGVAFQAKAELPQALNLSDTELCAMLSNALENALNAVQNLPAGAARTIDVLLCMRQGNLLLEVRNPYCGEIVMENGLPISKTDGAHYGCRSILSIAQQHHGLCTFTTENGVFTLRIAIPLS